MSAKQFIGLIASCVLATAHADLTNGLVAFYPFGGNANDATGNGHNGVVTGATLTPDRFGNPNSAYSFSGSSNYIRVAQRLTSTNPFSWTAWIKGSVASSTKGTILAQGGNPGATQCSPALWVNQSNQFVFYTYVRITGDFGQ